MNMNSSRFSFGCQPPNNIQPTVDRPTFGYQLPTNVHHIPSQERLETHNSGNNNQWQQQSQQQQCNWNSHFQWQPHNFWFPHPSHFGPHYASRFRGFAPPLCCTPPPQYQQSAPGSLFGVASTSNDTTTQNGSGVSQDFYWRDYNHGEIPHDALKGPDGTYIGQINYEGQILPACIIPLDKMAIAERAGKQVVTSHIRILCSPVPEKFYWESINFNIVTEFQLTNVIKGGYQDGYDLFIGKAFHEGQWKIGKVVPKENTFNKGLQVWDQNNRCALIQNFHILKYGNTPHTIKSSNNGNYNLHHQQESVLF